VAQSFVHGISLKNCLVGIIVPDREVLSVEAARLGLSDASLEELCKRDDIKKIILRDLTEIGDASELHGFEQVADIYLCPEPFSVENGLLTPTLKSKRPKLAEHFRNQIEAMYAKLD
jgi:long-chain acyl-CoA synthetase